MIFNILTRIVLATQFKKINANVTNVKMSTSAMSTIECGAICRSEDNCQMFGFKEQDVQGDVQATEEKFTCDIVTDVLIGPSAGHSHSHSPGYELFAGENQQTVLKTTFFMQTL